MENLINDASESVISKHNENFWIAVAPRVLFNDVAVSLGHVKYSPFSGTCPEPVICEGTEGNPPWGVWGSSSSWEKLSDGDTAAGVSLVPITLSLGSFGVIAIIVELLM